MNRLLIVVFTSVLAANMMAEDATKAADKIKLIAKRDLESETNAYTLKGLSTTNFKPEDIRAFHAATVIAFVDVDKSFGASRVRRMKTHPQMLKTWTTDEKPGEEYRVAQRELIGMAMHSEPVAYKANTVMNTASANETDPAKKPAVRKPTEFERSALEKFAAGNDLVTLENPGELRIVGAIRASKDCLSCHEVKEHDLLGAFTYRLIPKEELLKQIQVKQAEAPKFREDSQTQAIQQSR